MRLHGPRLMLTALGAEELAQIRWPREDEDARALFVERLREDPGARGWWAWVAALPDGDEVGSAGFSGRSGPDGSVTIGYAIHEDYRGEGYATEVLTLLAGWALAQPGVDRVRATIPPSNRVSIRVAEKAGFTASGEVVDDVEHGELIVFERCRPGLRRQARARGVG